MAKKKTPGMLMKPGGKKAIFCSLNPVKNSKGRTTDLKHLEVVSTDEVTRWGGRGCDQIQGGPSGRLTLGYSKKVPCSLGEKPC